MRVIVGLGNPGVSYQNTRHNVGFSLLDGIACGDYLGNAEIRRTGGLAVRKLFKSRTPFGKASGPYVSTEGQYYGTPFLLVKPTTYMNASGRAVSLLARKGKIRDENDLLVVVDDVNLELGRIRFREKGSAGGQKGLKSIIESLGTDCFHRLRIGIGPKPPGEDLSRFVLASFTPDEKSIMKQAYEVASEVVGAWIEGGAEKAFQELSRQGNNI